VEEVWYFIAGRGELWRRNETGEEVVEVMPGVGVTIPVGTAFQFRALEETDLVFVITTMPPWPGPNEAEPVEGRWQPTIL
jgi:mannose-6-phosphate isomerase-like protein (cupin superfamily)